MIELKFPCCQSPGLSRVRAGRVCGTSQRVDSRRVVDLNMFGVTSAVTGQQLEIAVRQGGGFVCQFQASLLAAPVDRVVPIAGVAADFGFAVGLVLAD